MTVLKFWNCTISDHEMYFKTLRKLKIVKAPAGFELKTCRSLADALIYCDIYKCKT